MLRLIDLREEKDLKQKDIAKLLKVSDAQYCRLESAVNAITHDKLIILANFYKTSIDYILNLTNERKSYPRGNSNSLRLKQLRKEKNLVGKEIASIVNLSQQQYSSLENGHFKIDYDKLIKFALYYQTSVDYILGLTDEAKQYDRIK